MNPYNDTSDYKKLKITPYVIGCGDIEYVIMHQLPISRRWVPVVKCVGIDYGVMVSFKSFDEATDYIKKHYKAIYPEKKSGHIINKLWY